MLQWTVHDAQSLELRGALESWNRKGVSEYSGSKSSRWFGHVERLDEYCMGRRVLMVDIRFGWVCGRLRLGWMVWRWPLATEEWWLRLCERWKRVKSSGAHVTDWILSHQFLLGPLFFWTALLCSGGYHLEMVGMPLPDVVGINYKKCTTTENQGAFVK